MEKLLSKIPHVARIVLGLIFFVFGLNGFFNFIPMPPPQGVAGQLMGAMAATGYMFPLLKTFEVVSGLLLLTGRFVPLAVAFLAPITINIFAFHLFLAPSGLPIGFTVIALNAYLAFVYRHAYEPMLRSRVPHVKRPYEEGETEASAAT